MKRYLSLLLILPFLFLVSCPDEGGSSAETYTVTFNTNGGGSIQPRTAENGKPVAKPNDPIKREQGRDQIFKGWYTEAALTNEYDFNTPVTSSFTLFAKWIPSVILTFDTQGGTKVDPKSIEPGLPAAAPPNPRRGGFTFAGWFTDAEEGTSYSFDAAVIADLTIFAHWEEFVIPGYPFGGLSGKTAMQYFTERELFVGWNAGDSLDAPNEQTWSNPPLNEAIFKGIKEAGFNLVRIPVTWANSNHPVGPAPDYTLNAAHLERVAEVVDMAYNAGLVAIINVHHDGYHSDNDVRWFSIRDARDSPAARERITAQYVKIWEQIAARFKDYGDWLIFEPLNEIHSGNWGWDRQGAPIAALEFEILNDWQQQFTNTVRASGGNNAERFLLVKPYCAKPHQVVKIHGIEETDPLYGTIVSTFRMPEDSASNKQILSFHYYDPETFALRGTNVNWDNINVYGSMFYKEQIPKLFAHFKRVFFDKGIPVIIGESGATYQPHEDNQANHDLAHKNRIEYMEYLYSYARQNGITPIYWDNGKYNSGQEKFGLFDRATGDPWNIGQEIINAIMAGIKGN